MSTSASAKSEPALVIEQPDAQRVQAQFTRLQMALGLKKAFESDDLAKLDYGSKLRHLDPVKPTWFDFKDDVVIISLDTCSTFERELLVGFEWAAHYLDTASLNTASPEEFVGKLAEIRSFGDGWSTPDTNPKRGLRNNTLACLRLEINDVFEPLCRDHCSNAEIHDDDTPIDEDRLSQRTDNICNSRRYHCEDPLHESDANNYDHTQHRACQPRKSIVLLLADKAESLRDLKMLGCDPHKRLQLRKANDWKQSHGHHSSFGTPSRPPQDLVSSREYEQIEPDIEVSESKQCTLLALRAAIDMAVRDATSRQWLRTREQVDGGLFPGPWMHFQNRDEVEAFLIEYDVARSKPLALSELRVQIAALKQSLQSLSRPAYDGTITHLARTHNYTSLLDKFPAPAPPKSRFLASAEEDARDTRTSNLSSSTLAEQRRKEIVALCDVYHAHQEEFETELYSIPVAAADKAEFQNLFDSKSFIDRQSGRAVFNRIPRQNYSRVFKIVKNTPGWKPSATLTKALRGTISGREEAQEFYRRLPASDLRRDGDEKHQSIIDVFKEGDAVLLGDERSRKRLMKTVRGLPLPEE